MRPNRTVRRPTRWTPEEWRRVEDAAEARSIPSARFVREAVLTACGGPSGAPAPVLRSSADELAHQLGRVLNNLRQLERAAAGGGDAAKVREAAAFTTDVLTGALRRVPARTGSDARLVEELVEAGRALNEIVRRAHAEQRLPPFGEVYDAVAVLYRFAKRRLP